MQYPYGAGAVSWTHGITVWRNNSYTPVFDTSYQYTLSANVTASNPMVMDSGTSPIQQWSKAAGLATSVFNMSSNGSNWTISPMNGAGKCLDAGAGTNGTGIVIAVCNGSASQNWNITAIAMNGSFNVAAASTGRCMNVRGASPAQGAVMEVDDCNTSSTSEQFNIQATIYAGDTSGSTGSTGSTGTNPCASFCANPTEFPQSFASGSIATTAACYETTAGLGGAQQSNMTGRTFSINGTAFTSGTLPAKVNGGYCVQVGAGGLSYASFSTW
jgi:hypothetical protein